MTTACAPGKVILCGEHAVVYGRPAIAVPVSEVQAQATVEPARDGRGVVIDAPDLNRRLAVRDADDGDPLARIVRLALRAIDVQGEPDLTITVTSTVPIARGMGSGAAVSTAIVRALAGHYDRWFSSRDISDLVYQTELIYHGTPSGIDNSTAAHGGLIFFRRNEAGKAQVRPLSAACSVPLVIALGREPRATQMTVGALRQRRAADPQRHEQLFDEIHRLVADAERAIVAGDLAELGVLMNSNHGLLGTLGVSTDELESMVTLARRGGALGAKLTGGGGGGAVICLCPDGREQLVDAFARAGWQAFLADIAQEGRGGADGKDDAKGVERRHAARA